MSDLKEKLAQASEKAVKEKKERRQRVIKGANLVETIKAKCEAAGLNFRENGGFFNFTGPAGKNVRIAIAKRGGIVDFLSFSIQSDAVRQVSKEEAEQKHLGRVQGRISYDAEDTVTLAAIDEAIKVLLTPAAEPVKVPKTPRTPKVPLATKLPEVSDIPVLT